MRHAIAVLVLAILASTVLTAQVGSMRGTVPSPTAASLGKFGDIPVSRYTGGWAGIGWTLEAGGAITRTVRGMTDEEDKGYFIVRVGCFVLTVE